jgi:hypothetical protein
MAGRDEIVAAAQRPSEGVDHAAIDRVTRAGVTTADDIERKADILILATGFQNGTISRRHRSAGS